jgi:hypothetical protein
MRSVAASNRLATSLSSQYLKEVTSRLDASHLAGERQLLAKKVKALAEGPRMCVRRANSRPRSPLPGCFTRHRKFQEGSMNTHLGATSCHLLVGPPRVLRRRLSNSSNRDRERWTRARHQQSARARPQRRRAPIPAAAAARAAAVSISSPRCVSLVPDAHFPVRSQ